MEKNNTTLRFKILTVLSVMLCMAFTSHAQYCVPDYTTGTGEGDYLDIFELGTIYNATGAGAEYNDYTALSTDLSVGSTYTAYITNTPTWGENYTIWIDYNQDLDFSDAGENCGYVYILAGSMGSITFTVPLTAMSGDTRLRVRCIYGGIAPYDPCASATWGETEDYTVNIGGGAANDVGMVNVTSPVSGVAIGVENITVTVQNYGSAEATEFNVNYSVDGGPTVTEAYGGAIAAYSTASYTFAATYDFTADACYSIMVWTEMEIDENLDNDDYSESVCNLGPITGTGAMYIYSNTTGGEPWFTTNNTTAMNTVWGPEGIGWTRDYFETVDPLAAFSSDNCFVFLEGSDGHAAELETFLGANITLIENWVASGGKLLLNAAPNEGDGMSFGFDGTSLFYAYFTSNATAVDAAHPIFNGPYLPAGTDYSGTSFGHASVSGTGLTNVMVDLFAPSTAVLAEKAWGDGWVMFGGMTTDNWHDPDPNAANLRANIIAYLSCIEILFCQAPGGQFVDGITENDATLHWDEVDGADQYRLVLWNTATGLIAKKGVTATTYNLVDNLTPLTTYAFRVKTVCYDDLEDISAPSPWYYWTTLGRIGDVNSSVAMYPNPNNGTFTIQVNGYENNEFALVVYDAIGKVVYNKTITISNHNYTETIALDNVSAGMYQVKLLNSEHQLTYPVMIQK